MESLSNSDIVGIGFVAINAITVFLLFLNLLVYNQKLRKPINKTQYAIFIVADIVGSLILTAILYGLVSLPFLLSA